MTASTLVAIPALNEAKQFGRVAARLARVRRDIGDNCEFDVLIVDDGSVDGTTSLAQEFGWDVVKHSTTQGYGASLNTAFVVGRSLGYRHVLTMDADGQHPPEVIPNFLKIRGQSDVISGSRYLPNSHRVSMAPAPTVNQFLTRVVNELFATSITDVGCGMKCINVEVMKEWVNRESGYLFPLEFWFWCAQSKRAVQEVPVPMIYLDADRNHERKFGSVELLIDKAVYVLLRVICDLNAPYSVNYGTDLDWCSQNGLLGSTVETIIALMQDGPKYMVPTELALKNLRTLSLRLIGFK